MDDVELKANGQKLLNVRQSIKVGVFVGGAKLEVFPEEVGQADLQKCTLAASQ